MYEKAVMVPNPETPNRAIVIDPELCKGCGQCVEVCRSDVMVPGPGKRQPPIVLYPDECWFCGCCVSHCPVAGAVRVEYPLHQKVGWKRKETGEYFRVGMKDPPPANPRPPVGERAGRPESRREA